MFNTKEFAWHNIEIALFGRVLTGARGVEYKVTKEKELVHGRGENPHSVQSGNKAYEGTLTLLQSEVEAIQRQLRDDQDLTDLEGFSVTVAYVPKTGANVVTHILKAVEFTEDPRAMNQNDKFQEIALPIIFLGREVV